MAADVVYGGVTIHVDPEGLARTLRSPDGPATRFMLVVAEKVKVATIASIRSPFPREFIGTRIVKRVDMRSDGPHVLVGSDRVKTEPHPIAPRAGHPFLKFKGRDGVDIYVHHVDHLGSDFTKYLAERLLAALKVVRV